MSPASVAPPCKVCRCRNTSGVELGEAVRLDPGEANAVYNLACVSAVKGLPDEALRWLTRLVELGYRDADHLAADPDLSTLRGDPRFISLLKSISGDTKQGG